MRCSASTEEIEYLCDAASGYFRTPVTADQVVWSYSGVRPLYDDGASEAQEATRDYVLKLDAAGLAPALLSIFGGKITTYRRLAEAALAILARPPARRRGGPRDGPVRSPCPAAIFRPTASKRW